MPETPLFERKVVPLMRDLLRDLNAFHGAGTVDVPDVAAMGGNFGVETGEWKLRLEGGKTDFDDTGYGLAQWTGSRRHDFDRWMRANGFADVANAPATAPDHRYDAACYGFLVYELTKIWEKRVLLTGGDAYYPGTRKMQSWKPLRQCETLEAKTLSFCALYERPGKPHLDRRFALARRALEAFKMASPQTDDKHAPAPAPAPVPAAPAAPTTSSNVVPAEWMPAADMRRIVVHWTAGRNKASADDVTHYHVLVEGDGTLRRGTKSIKDNESTTDGVYAAHTRSLNTNSIGVSMCGMFGAVESPFDPGPNPINRQQWLKTARVVAELARRYKIEITPRTVLTHAEVEPVLGVDQVGKWDITRIPWDDKVRGHKACGDLFRADARAALSVVPAGTGTAAAGTTTVVVATTAAWYAGIPWEVIIPIAVIAIGAVVAGVFIARSRR